MAALLRFGAARACRLLAAYAVRSPSIYQRNSVALHKEYILKACLPRVSASRYLNSETTASETVEETTEKFSAESVTTDRTDFPDTRHEREKQRNTLSGRSNYERNVNQLGSINIKRILLRTFENILQIEGQLTPLQAYQVIRNCGTQLKYERPEKRIELAHYMWDKIVETGVKPNETLYNALLSVYVQNNHIFDPLEVLEQMELQTVEPNRTTLLLLMKGFAQKGDVSGAFKILEYIKAAKMMLTEDVYALLVTAYGRSGDIESAKGVFQLMEENNLKPDINCYTALLMVCGDAGNMEAVFQTVHEMQENRVYPNKKVFLSLLDSLSKGGQTALIKELLDNALVKSLVEKYLREFMITVTTRGEINTAFLLLGYIPKQAGVVTASEYERNETSLLKTVIMSGQSMDVIMVTIREMEKLGIFNRLYEDALYLSYNAKNPELGYVLLQEMLQKNMTVRNHYFFPLMSVYCQRKDYKAALDVVDLMVAHGMKPDAKILRYLVESLGEAAEQDVETIISLSEGMPTTPYMIVTMAQLIMMSGKLDKLDKIVELAQKENVNLRSISAGFDEYLNSKVFDPEIGAKVVEFLDQRNIAVRMGDKIWNKLRADDPDSIKDNATFVTLLLKAGLSHQLDSRTYTTLLAQFARLQMSDEFYEFLRVLKEYEVQLDHHQYRQMLRMMSYDGKAEAAQFCFDKLQKETEPTKRDYSLLIEAYANCPDGGFTTKDPRERNIRRIRQLYQELSSKGFNIHGYAAGAVNIAHLRADELEQAEEIKSIHGPGKPTYTVLQMFMKSHAHRGDVRKTLEYFEEMKKISTQPNTPTFVYNNLLHVYGFHGDVESQMRVFQEMKRKEAKPNQNSYSKLVDAFCKKDDIKTALSIFQEAKEVGPFIGESSCLLLLNSMARSGQTEQFESVLEDIVSGRIARTQHQAGIKGMLKGLVFCCVHAGKKDIAWKLILENDLQLDSSTFFKFARNSSFRGEVNAVLNAIEFLKEANITHTELYLPLIRAYDAKRDSEAVKAVYNKMVEEGVQMDEDFLQQYNQILIKYSDRISGGELNRKEWDSQTQTVQEESDSSSDEEIVDTREFDEEKSDADDIDEDIEEMKDPK